MSNGDVSKKIEEIRTLIHRVRKCELKFIGYIVRKEYLENFILTGYIEGNRDRGKHKITCLTRLWKWLPE